MRRLEELRRRKRRAEAAQAAAERSLKMARQAMRPKAVTKTVTKPGRKSRAEAARAAAARSQKAAKQTPRPKKTRLKRKRGTSARRGRGR